MSAIQMKCIAALVFVGLLLGFDPPPAAAFDLAGAFRALDGLKVGTIQPTVAAGSPLRVATYNLHGAFQVTPFFLGQTLRKIAPDVALLTEAVEGPAYGSQPATIGLIARLPYRAFQRNTDVWTRIDGLGNAILSRTPLTDIRRVMLPLLDPKNEARGLLTARTIVAGREVVFACTHLSRATCPEERARQIAFIADYLNAEFPGLPVVLGGDFNTGAGDERFAPLCPTFDEAHAAAVAAGLATEAEGWTIDAKQPTARFDHLFLAKNKFDIKRSGAVAADASDHRPAAAEIVLK